jgi:Peptidase family M48
VGTASLVTAALIALATGCAHRAMLYGEPVPDGCTADGPRGSEQCMSWWIDRTKMLVSPELADPELHRYVDRVAQRVANAAGDHRTWQVRIVDTADIQAEANIWSTLYITRGALVRLRDESELAAVLGHEIGHVIAGHLTDEVVEHDRGLREQSRDLTSQRDDESQADELGVEYCARAGYDVTAMERMLRALAAGDPPDDPDRGSDPHPRWNPRLARVQSFAMHFHSGETNAPEFLRHIAGLVVGEDPRNDAIVDNVVVFSRVGVAIDLAKDSAGAIAGNNTVTLLGRNDEPDSALYLAQAGGASWFKSTPEHLYTLVPLGKQMLVIATNGPDRVKLAAQIRAAIRLPRPSELQRLVPERVDTTAKRALWPDAPPSPSIELTMSSTTG